MRRQLLKWLFVTLLALANLVLLAVLAAWLYAKVVYGPMMGRGPSVSEMAWEYVWLILYSARIALIALVGTTLYWLIGLTWLPNLQTEEHQARNIKLSLVLVPSSLVLIYLLSLWISVRF